MLGKKNLLSQPLKLDESKYRVCFEWKFKDSKEQRKKHSGSTAPVANWFYNS